MKTTITIDIPNSTIKRVKDLNPNLTLEEAASKITWRMLDQDIQCCGLAIRPDGQLCSWGDEELEAQELDFPTVSINTKPDEGNMNSKEKINKAKALLNYHKQKLENYREYYASCTSELDDIEGKALEEYHTSRIEFWEEYVSQLFDARQLGD